MGRAVEPPPLEGKADRREQSPAELPLFGFSEFASVQHSVGGRIGRANQGHQSVAHLLQDGIETSAAHGGLVLVEQGIIRIAPARQRLRALSHQRDQPLKGWRKQGVIARLTCLFPSTKRLRSRMGEMAHEILGQR